VDALRFGGDWLWSAAGDCPVFVDRSRQRNVRSVTQLLDDLIVALLVGVEPDSNHRVLLIVDAVCDVEAVGQSCVE
jgi:hypothetical protein